MPFSNGDGKIGIQKELCVWFITLSSGTFDFSDAIQLITKAYNIWSCNSQNLEAHQNGQILGIRILFIAQKIDGVIFMSESTQYQSCMKAYTMFRIRDVSCLLKLESIFPQFYSFSISFEIPKYLGSIQW